MGTITGQCRFVRVCVANFTKSAERKSLLWAVPAVITSKTAFWSLMIRTTSECSGSSTPQALSNESNTYPGRKRNCPARMNTESQEKRRTKQVGMWTTSFPTAALAVFRTHSAETRSNEMSRLTSSMRFESVADSNAGSSGTITRTWW